MTLLQEVKDDIELQEQRM